MSLEQGGGRVGFALTRRGDFQRDNFKLPGSLPLCQALAQVFVAQGTLQGGQQVQQEVDGC